MISQKQENPIISTDFALPKDQTASSILSFLSDVLPEFETEMKGSSIKKEDEISLELNLFLQEKAKSKNYLISFNGKKGVDFAIHVTPFTIGSLSLFVIEAKRLPPTNNKDYVVGDTGGIERFKKEQEGFGMHLKTSAMLGYIQERDKTHWHSMINKWIDECILSTTSIQWDENDKLSPSTIKGDYFSTHIRLTQPTITLYHFWLDLTV